MLGRQGLEKLWNLNLFQFYVPWQKVPQSRAETAKMSQGAPYKRGRRRQSQSETWGSAITPCKDNHGNEWESAKFVDKERSNEARGIKEAVVIRKVPSFNSDEERHHLSHLYDNFLWVAMRTQRERERRVYILYHTSFQLCIIHLLQ